MVIIGGSGAGKTTTLRHLTAELRSQGLPVLVLDFHGDIDPRTESDEKLVTFRYENNQQFINPFHIDPRYSEWLSPTRVKNEFIEAWKSHYPTLGVQQINHLRKVIEAAFESAGIDADPSTWAKSIDFSDVMEAFERTETRAAVRDRPEAYFARLAESQVFHGPVGVPIEQLLDQSYRLDMRQLDDETRNVVADVVLRRVFLMAQGLAPIPSGTTGWDKFRLYVVIDEAQILMRGAKDGRASLAKYASEARKFGIGLILSTQLRDNVPSDIWANTGTKFFMQALDRSEQIQNARAAGVAESQLAELPVGSGLLFSGGMPGNRPTGVQINPR